MAATYYAQIQKWDWERIERLAKDRSDAVERDGQLVGSCYLGSVMNLTPSGKFYTFWTSNQTASDVDRDGRWYHALDRAAFDHGGYIENGEGDPTDLYFCVLIEDVEVDATMKEVRDLMGIDRYRPAMDGEDEAAASATSPHTEGN